MTPRMLLVGGVGGLLLGAAVVAMPGFVVASLILLGVGLLLRRWASPEDRPTLMRIYVTAVLVRVAVGGLLHLWAMYAGSGYMMYGQESFDVVSGDSAWMSLRGWIIARTREGVFDRGTLDHGIFEDQATWLVYPYVWFHYLFGFAQFSVKLLNSVLGALTAVAVYAMTKTLAGRRTAALAAWLTALYPSTLLWSVTNLKEPATALGLAWACWATIRLVQQERSWRPLAHLAGGLGLLGAARPSLVAPAILCLGAGGLLARLSGRPRPRAIAAVGLAVAVVLLGLPWLARLPVGRYWSGKLHGTVNQMISRQRGVTLSGGASYHIYEPEIYEPKNIDIQFALAPPQLARAFVVAWGYFLFSPVPWRAANAVQAAAIPEMCLWYALLACAVLGVGSLWRRRCWESVLLLVVVVVLTSLIAMGTGNIGVAFRHRAILIPLYLTFSAVGLGAVWRKMMGPDASPAAVV